MSPRRNFRVSRYLQAKKQQNNLPDITLCEECKALGYCKATISDHFPSEREMAKGTVINQGFDLSDYTSRIPLRVDVKLGLSEYATTHLQVAYDAFHQDDFETALLHFKSVTVGGVNYLNADYFLAVCYFMVGDYQMAHLHIQACIDNTFFKEKDFSDFLDECSRRSVARQLTKENIAEDSKLNCMEEELMKVLL